MPSGPSSSQPREAPRADAEGGAGSRASGKGRPSAARRRNAVIFLAVGCAWLALDLLTKAAVSGAAVGEALGPGIPGVLDLRLVHNTGAAWGLFGDMTLALGIVSLVVCALAALYLFAIAPASPPVVAVALGLVVAGGVGNALDRMTRGYVVDFIEPAFIDFPVFNVADIGVTCGVALFVAALAVQAVRNRG